MSFSGTSVEIYVGDSYEIIIIVVVVLLVVVIVIVIPYPSSWVAPAALGGFQHI